jgi:uncharacterized protein (TIGR03435 family)
MCAIGFRAALSLAFVARLVIGGQAQAPLPSADAAFEVASVKRNMSGETRLRFETPAGRVSGINVPLRFLIRQAYRVPEARIVGGPTWVDTDRFDILATAPASSNADTTREMLRTLLKERFGLTVHAELREMPIYVLRLARTDGTLGPNLRHSTTDCTRRGSTVVAGSVQCGILVSQGPGSGSLRGGSATIDNFVRLLGDFLERPLNDGTGLTGLFDLELQIHSGTEFDARCSRTRRPRSRLWPRRDTVSVYRASRTNGSKARRGKGASRCVGHRHGVVANARLIPRFTTGCQ